LGKKEISLLKRDFDKGKGAKFFVIAKVKRREPISADLTNLSVTWDFASVGLEEY
jgi:hypothetical protein